MKTKDIEAHVTTNGEAAAFAAAVGYVGEHGRFVGSKRLDKVRFIKNLGGGRVKVEVVSGPRDGRQATVRVQDVYATWEEHEVARKKHEAREQEQRDRRNRLRDIAEEALESAGIDLNTGDVARCLHELGSMIDRGMTVTEVQPHVYRVAKEGQNAHSDRLVVHLIEDRKFTSLNPGGWQMADTDRAARLMVKMHVRGER